VTIKNTVPGALRVWLPAIRANSGADIFVIRLAQALRRAGHVPLVQWFNHGYELIPELMNLHKKPEHIDIIHANSWNSYVFLGQDIPLVTTVLHVVHDPAYAPYRSMAQALYHRGNVWWREAFAIEHSTAVTAISNYVGQTVRDIFGRMSVQIIANWVDTDLYKPSPEYKLPVSHRFRLFMVGNHSRRKGYDLLTAFGKALGPDYDLRCTGGLRGHGSSAGNANVTFLGRLSEEDLLHEYKYCDAVLSLSRYEGFGYTALEGMACGKPFLGFNTSGLTDVVVDGITGYLVPINDVTALVERCTQLSKNIKLFENMGHAGRQRALNVFTEKVAVDSYIALYRTAIMYFHKLKRV